MAFEFTGLVRRQTDRYFLSTPRPAELVDEVTSPQQPQTRNTVASQSMHASNHAVILRQWSEWNETIYDILIASVKLSPTQHAYVSSNFAQESDGLGFYQWVISHADTSKGSAQARLKRELRDLKITADMNSDQVKSALEAIEEKYPLIKEHLLIGEWNRPAITLALGMFPPDHPDTAYITAQRVQHAMNPSSSWPTFTRFRNDIIEWLAYEEENRRTSGAGTNPTALALHGRQTGSTHRPANNGNASTGSCSTCDLRRCTGTPCFVFGNCDPPKSAKFRSIINFFKDYAAEKGLKKSMKGNSPSDEWMEKHKAKNAAKRSQAEAKAATSGESANATVEQASDDFWDTLNGNTTFVTAEDIEAIGDYSIAELSDQLQANMEPPR